MQIRQLTYSNVAIRVKTAKGFYELQNSLIEHCGFIWRGRENNPKYEESYDNLVNLFGENFIMIFPNENTIDVVSKEKRFSIEQSGRSIIELDMTLKGIQDRFDPRTALIKRFQSEYEKSLLPPPPIKKVNKIPNKVETMFDIFEDTGNLLISSDFIGKNPKNMPTIGYLDHPSNSSHAIDAHAFAMMSDSFPMAKPKQKKTKLSKKKDGNVVSFSEDELIIIQHTTGAAKSLSLNQLESMLLISKVNV